MSWISNPDPLPVAQGGTGTSNPSLVAGVGIAISGAWPNQTVTNTGGAGTYTEVVNFAALPAAAAHTGEIYVVLVGTGVYFINRKPAGFYVSDGIDWTMLGDLPSDYFADNVLRIYDDADPTKVAAFDVSGIATGTTRTFAYPNASGTLALTSDIPSPVVQDVTATAPLASSGGATPDISLTGLVPISNGGTGSAAPSLVNGVNTAVTGAWPNQAVNFDGILPVASGGSGTATPSLVAGTNVTITGTWPNQTVNASGGGGGGSATTVEVDLGSTPVFRGKFTITDAGIGATSKVLAWQAPGPYTGKGTRADEAEMAPVQIIAVEPAVGSAVVYWQTPPIEGAVPYSESGGGGGRVNQLTTTFNHAMSRAPVLSRRANKVRGNVKFSYQVLT